MAGTGGARPGAGRPKGRKNTRTLHREKALREGGILPLDYMLKILRDPKSKPEDARWAAQTAAPFVHPKLQAVEMTADVTVSHEQALDDLE